jgi:hypothetical protein
MQVVAAITVFHNVVAEGAAHALGVALEAALEVLMGVMVDMLRLHDHHGDARYRAGVVVVYVAQHARQGDGHKAMAAFELGVEVPPLDEILAPVGLVTGGVIRQDFVTCIAHAKYLPAYIGYLAFSGPIYVEKSYPAKLGLSEVTYGFAYRRTHGGAGDILRAVGKQRTDTPHVILIRI